MAGSAADDVRKVAVFGPGLDLAEDTKSPPTPSTAGANPRLSWDISKQVDHHRGPPTKPGPWKVVNVTPRRFR